MQPVLLDSTKQPSFSTRKRHIATHFANAPEYGRYASVQAQVCELLLQRIHSAYHSKVLEIGAGQGQLTKKLIKAISADSWYINELCAEHVCQLRSLLPSAHLCIGDGEYLSLPEALPNKLDQQFSLLISASAVQWFDNPLNIIAQASRYLQAGGQLLFNSFTPNNFYQIKQLTGQGLDYPKTEQWQDALVEQGFDLREISTHRYQLSFASPYEVLKHVKQTGVSVVGTSIDPKRNEADFRWTKSSLTQFDQDYQRLFSDDKGNVLLTYEVLLVDAIAL